MNNNELENSNPDYEFEKRMWEKDEYWKTIHHYDINTSIIYDELKNNWKKYDIEIIDKVEAAIHHIHNIKRIMTYCYLNDGSEIAKNKINGHMESIKRGYEKPISPDDFPIAYYYYGGHYNDMPYIVCMCEHCAVKRDDNEFDLLFAVQFSLTPILECREFLEYHLNKSFNDNIAEFAEYLDNICLQHKEFLAEKHKPFCEKFINNILLSKEMPDKTLLKAEITPKIKLNWLGSPSQFSYIFLELAKNGFIEIPSTNGEASYSRFSKVCWDLFEFKNKTTLENLQKEMNPNKNTLSEGVKRKFTFPSLDEVSSKKKK